MIGALPGGTQLRFELNDLPDIEEEPGINAGDPVELFDAHSQLKAIAKIENVVGTRHAEPFPDARAPFFFSCFVQFQNIDNILPVRAQAEAPLFKRAQ